MLYASTALYLCSISITNKRYNTYHISRCNSKRLKIKSMGRKAMYSIDENMQSTKKNLQNMQFTLGF